MHTNTIGPRERVACTVEVAFEPVEGRVVVLAHGRARRSSSRARRERERGGTGDVTRSDILERDDGSNEERGGGTKTS